MLSQTTTEPRHSTAISSRSTEQNTTQKRAPTPELSHADFVKPPIEEELAASIAYEAPTTPETTISAEGDSLPEHGADMDILAYDEPVMILEGTENKWLCVHAAPFFAVCHMERWHKTERGLEVLCPHGILKTILRRILLIFLHWLYNDTFLCGDENKALTYPQLIDLYLLGEKWNAPLFRNAIISYIVDKAMLHRGSFPIELSKRIYAETRPQAPLRVLWKDICWTMNTKRFHEAKEAGVHLDATSAPNKFATKSKTPSKIKDISCYQENDPVTGLKQREGIAHCKHGSCGPGRAGDTPVSCEAKLAVANAEIENLKRQLEDQGKLDDSSLLIKKRKAGSKSEGA